MFAFQKLVEIIFHLWWAFRLIKQINSQTWAQMTFIFSATSLPLGWLVRAGGWGGSVCRLGQRHGQRLLPSWRGQRAAAGRVPLDRSAYTNSFVMDEVKMGRFEHWMRWVWEEINMGEDEHGIRWVWYEMNIGWDEHGMRWTWDKMSLVWDEHGRTWTWDEYGKIWIWDDRSMGRDEHGIRWVWDKMNME